MSTAKKVLYVAGVVLAVALAYVIMLASMDFIRDSAGYATEQIEASEHADSYVLTKAATSSAPYWLLFIPAAVGGISIVVILKQKTY